MNLVQSVGKGAKHLGQRVVMPKGQKKRIGFLAFWRNVEEWNADKNKEKMGTRPPAMQRPMQGGQGLSGLSG